MELRFMAANADLQEGDLLSTSGVDGIYPAGLPVAKIERIERRADSAFARIYCVPLARVTAARYVLVLEPSGAPVAPPHVEAASTQRKRPEGKPGAGKNEKKPAGATR
ncbi:rod shape-determining protein MreC [compost metagenome]